METNSMLSASSMYYYLVAELEFLSKHQPQRTHLNTWAGRGTLPRMTYKTQTIHHDIDPLLYRSAQSYSYNVVECVAAFQQNESQVRVRTATEPCQPQSRHLVWADQTIRQTRK